VSDAAVTWEPPALAGADYVDPRHPEAAREAWTRFVDVPLSRLMAPEVWKLRTFWREPDPERRVQVEARRRGAPALVSYRQLRIVKSELRSGIVDGGPWLHHVALLYEGALPVELAPCIYGAGFTEGTGPRARRVATVTGVAWYQIVWRDAPEPVWRELRAWGMRAETGAALGAPPGVW